MGPRGRAPLWENPHQRAALYISGFSPEGLATATQLHGKAMSYNNYVDAEAAHRAAYDFDQPAVVIVKHANPCGIAVGVDLAEACRKALATDPRRPSAAWWPSIAR